MPPSSRHLIKIPCKRYLVKFAAGVYGTPLLANTDSLIGHFIALAIEKKTYTARSSRSQGGFELDGILEVSISRFLFERAGFDISNAKAAAVNSFLEEMFTEHLYRFCLTSSAKDVRYKGIDGRLREFAAQYNLELEDDLSGAKADISFDALKKKEYRKRKLMEKHRSEFEKKCAQVSSRILQPQNP